MTSKTVLTTGDIAKYCNVNFRTVVRWIDRGLLKSHKLPGRGDNRVQIKDFVYFLKQNDMPVPREFRILDLKVLIVDDDKDVIALLSSKLKSKGFTVKTASNGFIAGSLLHTFNPAVMILDLKMPGLSGHDVIRCVRDLPEYSQQKILVLSGSSDGDLEEAKKLGANECMKKPFEVNALVDCILNLIEKDV